MNTIIVVYNPASGNASLEAIKQAFAQHSAEPSYISVSSKKLSRTLRSLGAKRNVTVVAAGGDGTINTVVRYIHNTSICLGIIPMGTLNHFAKALHVPLKTPEAVAVIVHGKQRQVDIGTVNDYVFVNNSSMGFYPRSLLIRDQLNNRLGKWPAATVGFLHAVIHPRQYYVDIVTGDTRQTLRTPFVFIGNNSYEHTPPNIGERKTLTSGQLAIYVVRTTSPPRIIWLLIRSLLSHKRHTEDLGIYLTNSCTIHTRHHRRIHVACDGEVITTKTPLHYRSEARGLRVIAP